MEQRFWELFYLSLACILIFAILFIFGFVLYKKVFINKKNGLLLLICYCAVILALIVGSLLSFFRCYNDVKLVKEKSYPEIVGVITEFTYSKRDADGNGKIVNKNPKIYIIDEDAYIILHLFDVELGKKYKIRYLPSTKIAEVVEEIIE